MAPSRAPRRTSQRWRLLILQNCDELIGGEDEATAWLGRPVLQPATLAELYAMRDGAGPAIAATPATTATGQYL